MKHAVKKGHGRLLTKQNPLSVRTDISQSADVEEIRADNHPANAESKSSGDSHLAPESKSKGDSHRALATSKSKGDAHPARGSKSKSRKGKAPSSKLPKTLKGRNVELALPKLQSGLLMDIKNVTWVEDEDSNPVRQIIRYMEVLLFSRRLPNLVLFHKTGLFRKFGSNQINTTFPDLFKKTFQGTGIKDDAHVIFGAMQQEYLCCAVSEFSVLSGDERTVRLIDGQHSAWTTIRLIAPNGSISFVLSGDGEVPTHNLEFTTTFDLDFNSFVVQVPGTSSASGPEASAGSISYAAMAGKGKQEEEDIDIRATQGRPNNPVVNRPPSPPPGGAGPANAGPVNPPPGGGPPGGPGPVGPNPPGGPGPVYGPPNIPVLPANPSLLHHLSLILFVMTWFCATFLAWIVYLYMSYVLPIVDWIVTTYDQILFWRVTGYWGDFDVPENDFLVDKDKPDADPAAHSRYLAALMDSSAKEQPDYPNLLRAFSSQPVRAGKNLFGLICRDMPEMAEMRKATEAITRWNQYLYSYGRPKVVKQLGAVILIFLVFLPLFMPFGFLIEKGFILFIKALLLLSSYHPFFKFMSVMTVFLPPEAVMQHTYDAYSATMLLPNTTIPCQPWENPLLNTPPEQVEWLNDLYTNFTRPTIDVRTDQCSLLWWHVFPLHVLWVPILEEITKHLITKMLASMGYTGEIMGSFDCYYGMMEALVKVAVRGEHVPLWSLYITMLSNSIVHSFFGVMRKYKFLLGVWFHIGWNLWAFFLLLCTTGLFDLCMTDAANTFTSTWRQPTLFRPKIFLDYVFPEFLPNTWVSSIIAYFDLDLQLPMFYYHLPGVKSSLEDFVTYMRPDFKSSFLFIPFLVVLFVWYIRQKAPRKMSFSPLEYFADPDPRAGICIRPICIGEALPPVAPWNTFVPALGCHRRSDAVGYYSLGLNLRCHVPFNYYSCHHNANGAGLYRMAGLPKRYAAPYGTMDDVKSVEAFWSGEMREFSLRQVRVMDIWLMIVEPREKFPWPNGWHASQLVKDATSWPTMRFLTGT